MQIDGFVPGHIFDAQLIEPPLRDNFHCVARLALMSRQRIGRAIDMVATPCDDGLMRIPLES